MKPRKSLRSAQGRRSHRLPRGLVAISIADYVKLHAASNPGTDTSELKALEYMLEAKLAEARCECGERIWAIGWARVGMRCFTCNTGEAVPDNDYEIV